MTEKKRLEILNDMVIICDTREKQNQHIIEYLEKEKIPYKHEKMDTADYTCEFPNHKEINLDHKILVERKGSLSELAGNFTTHRARFIREFERVESDQKIHMVVETATWRKIFNGTYRTKIHPNTYKANLFTFGIRYNCPIWFCEKRESGEIIHKILHYEINERLRAIDDE